MAEIKRRITNPKILELFERIIKEEIYTITYKLMDEFYTQILPFQDEEDPAKPSLCRDEFEIFIEDSISESLKVIINEGSIEIGLGDEDKLGFNDELSEETTDCLKIIGTILQGISGNYVLVTSEMTGGPEGRFGRAFIMPEEQYRVEAVSHGWYPNKPMWKFSNFPGMPAFFLIDMNDVVARITKKASEALSRL